ncbi:MAG TPA: alpha/beta fold hydrolase [Ktedonobacterales bacterium]
MEVTIEGARIFCQPVGSERNYPLFALHGGPGLDHTSLHPWLDALADQFYLIYVDQRGQGRSERVDPTTLTLSRFARDVTLLAQELGLPRYALLGHSFGAMVSVVHAAEQGTASHYVISDGTASFSKSIPEINANIEAMQPEALREQVRESWALEPDAKTQADVAHLLAMQMPFHFADPQGEPLRRFMAEQSGAIYAPEVLAYFAENEYAMEYEDQLGRVSRPTLVITGAHDRTCTPRAARDIVAGVPGSELVILPDSGHMGFVEQPGMYFAAVRDFFARHPTQS